MKKQETTRRYWRARLISTLAACAVGSALFATSYAQTNEIREVTDVLTREAAAVEKGDLAALDELWANDASVTVFENGHANYGWSDYRNSHLAPELKEFKNTKYAFTDLKVKVSGNTAWATFKYMLAAETAKGKVESGGLATAVLENMIENGGSFIGIRVRRGVRHHPPQRRGISLEKTSGNRNE